MKTMSNNTTVSDITKPTQYTLLDNNHRYLPREFTFIPTVSAESAESDENNITETVKSALNKENEIYYECTPQDFVYNIKVKDNLENVVYKTDNKSAYVYKIDSEGNDVYKYCEDTAKVNVQVLYDNGVNNIDISNVTVEKDKNALVPIANSLDCTKPGADKKITVPMGYESLEINSSNVYFRQENSSENPSWVTISNNDNVSFSNDIMPDSNIIERSDNNFKISLNNPYICNNMADIDLVGASTELNSYNSDSAQKMSLVKALGHEIKALVKTALKDTSTSASLDKDSLNTVAENLLAATDLGSAATDLGSAASGLGNAFIIILNASLLLKRQELLSNNEWKKKEKVSTEDRSSLNNIINNFIKELNWDNELAESFDKLKATYVIYNGNNEDIGFMDVLEKIVVVIDNESSVLKEILEYYCNNTDKSYTDIVALGNNKEMIMYKEPNNIYKLIYRDNSNIKSILSGDDSFITTVTSTEP